MLESFYDFMLSSFVTFIIESRFLSNILELINYVNIFTLICDFSIYNRFRGNEKLHINLDNLYI